MKSSFPMEQVLYQSGISSIHWDEKRNKVYYIKSMNGQSQIMEHCLVQGGYRILTSAPAPSGSIGYGNGAYSYSDQKISYCGKDKKLYVIDLVTEETYAVTGRFEGLSCPCWSPCGNYIAFIAEMEQICNIYLVDIRVRGKIQQLSDSPWFAFNPQISADGKSIQWMEWDRDCMPWQQSRIVWSHWQQKLTDLAPGVFPIVENKIVLEKKGCSINAGEISPDGQCIAYCSDESGWRQIYLLQKGDNFAHTKRISHSEEDCAGPDWVPALRWLQWSSDGKSLVFISNKENRKSLCALSLADGEVKTIFDECTSIDDFQVGDQSFLCLGSHPTFARRLYIAGFNLKKTDCDKILCDEQAGLFQKESLVSAEILKWQTVDGSILHGVYYPAHGSQNTHKPLIVMVHGGPTTQADFDWRPQAQYFASKGYGVLFVNHRGSTGFGRVFQEKLCQNWGVYDREDARSGAQYLVDKGFADKNQLVIMGGSAGGYTTLMAMTHDADFWSAGISSYGIGDLYELEQGCHKFEKNYNQILIGPLPAMGSVWKERSPLYHAGQVKKPLLLFHGKKDVVVPFEQSVEMEKRVTRAGSTCKLVLFEDEGHGFRNIANKKTFMLEVEKFLHKYVLCAQ